MEINKHLMDIFEFAKKMELDGRAMYEGEIEKTNDPGLKKILRMLVKAEKNHYNVLVWLEKKKKLTKGKSVLNTSMSDIKNIFQKMKESGEELITSSEHVSFYNKALTIEEKSEALYRSEAEKCTDEYVKNILIEIAREEHRHVVLMQNFVELLMNPKQWVENGEYIHLEDY